MRLLSNAMNTAPRSLNWTAITTLKFCPLSLRLKCGLAAHLSAQLSCRNGVASGSRWLACIRSMKHDSLFLHDQAWPQQLHLGMHMPGTSSVVQEPRWSLYEYILFLVVSNPSCYITRGSIKVLQAVALIHC